MKPPFDRAIGPFDRAIGPLIGPFLSGNGPIRRADCNGPMPDSTAGIPILTDNGPIHGPIDGPVTACSFLLGVGVGKFLYKP